MPTNRMSVATITAPEFINITGISPFVSKGECKVFYLGQNRNGSFIDKEAAMTMAQTLPGCPVVGYYSEQKEDFRDHGELVTIDGDGIHFKCQTVPYGFVAPDTKVWFKDFEDTDEFGNTVIRTYLMTECYLWTKQYKEAQMVLNEGRPHSMELDEETLKGHWSTDNNRGIEFFIINDAIFSKLCILGEDVEPCFEGSSITAPNVSASFTKDEKVITHTLYSMMKELKELTYSLKEGEKTMDENTNVTPVAENAKPAETPAENTEFEKNSKNEDKVNSENPSEIQNNVEEFKKNETNENKEKEEGQKDDNSSKSDDETGKKEDEDEKEKKVPAKNSLVELEEKYALLETQYNELQEKFTSLENQNKELNEFKLSVENSKKDELIASFYMLSDEDKKDVIENKSKYSLEDIESKLSVICVRKKVSFANDEDTNTPPTIFNLSNNEANSDLPAWLKKVEEKRNSNV